MSDLRDSGEIEADADTILMLYRDAYYNKSTADDVVEILIQKQRQGECGVMAGALFVGAYQQFRPLAWEYKPSEPEKTTGGYE
jgi:replicative DNA helicase